MNSQKLICKTLHNQPSSRREWTFSPGPVLNPKPYMLWRRIKMQKDGYKGPRGGREEQRPFVHIVIRAYLGYLSKPRLYVRDVWADQINLAGE